MNSIVLALDRSTQWGGLHFSRDGARVTLEESLRSGFIITSEDAPAVVTLLARHIDACDEFAVLGAKKGPARAGLKGISDGDPTTPAAAVNSSDP